jgi:DNA repair ATPase RecN
MQGHAPFEITSEIKGVIEDIIEAQKQNDSDLVDELTEKLISLINSESNRYEAMAHVIKNCENTAKEINKIAKTLRERVKQHMKQLDLLRVDAVRFTVTRTSSSKVKIDVNVSIAELPERFQRITANKPELKRALSNGEKVEGVQLEQGEHIQINYRIRE